MPNTAPCRSELAHESCISAAEDLVDVPTSSRASSLPPMHASHRRLHGGHCPCGSELAREDCISAAEDLVDVPTSSRASSLPPMRVSRRRLHGGHCPCGSELAHEGCISAAEYLAAVPTFSRASSLPRMHVSRRRLHGGHCPCGSELAHESCISAAEDLAYVPTSSRASSLPPMHVSRRRLMPDTALVGVSLLAKAVFQPLKIWRMSRHLREHASSHLISSLLNLCLSGASKNCLRKPAHIRLKYFAFTDSMSVRLPASASAMPPETSCIWPISASR